MPLPTTGKWYWEVTPSVVATSSATRTMIGIMGQAQINYVLGQGADCFAYTAQGSSLSKVTANIFSSYGDSYAANDVIGVAVDLDNGAIYFSKNGTFQNGGVPTSGASRTGAAFTTLISSNNYFPAVGYWGTFNANFGQRPFVYTPPTGFVRLNTFNLPTPTIGATASTTANKYMNIALYTGTGSSQSITGLGFQPDWTWIKGRSGATDHGLYDAVRGVQNQLESNNFNVETAEATGLTAFGSNGFTVGALAQLNTSSATYVGWNWKANGAGVSNTDGTITSTVSANTTAGFSIVTYTGNGSSGATVGHGLSVTPSMVILKSRSSATNWQVKHSSLNANQNLNLNLTDAVDTAPGSGYVSAISSSTLTLLSGGSIGNVNGSGDTYVAYCFAQIAGYSAFGSYTGNGSSDGTFVFTGFRPAFLLIKRTDSAGGWYTYDDARSTYNLNATILQPNLSDAEFTGTNNSYDFLSNGFKNRGTGGDNNASGGTYIYMAFAESPFKYSLAR